MPYQSANGITLYYETRGDASAPPLLLISGLGSHVTSWPNGFVQRLADEGFFVVTYDNRDVGLSTHLDEHGMPDAAGVLFGEVPPPYTIADMAADGAFLVRELIGGPVHVVGVSMGGMIAQQFAIDYPELTRTLTSIMSTPAPMDVGQPTSACAEMLTRTRSQNRDEFLQEELENWRLTNGSAYPLDEDWVIEQAVTAAGRNPNPVGVARHLAAVVGSPDRRPGLATVTVPSLVLHGDEDPLVSVSGGYATHEALPSATLRVFEGVGHSLPAPLWDDVAREIGAVAARA